MDAVHDGLPANRRLLRLFILFAVVAVFILYWLDLQLSHWLSAKTVSLVLQRHGPIVRSILENLIAGAIGAILLALGSRWVISVFDPRDRVIEVPPASITSRLIKNAEGTRTYTFLGNTASFVTAAILPILVDSARRSGHPRTVRLFLMDPTADSAIAAYVGYRDRVARALSIDADRELARWISPQREVHGERAENIAAKVVAAVYLAAYASTHAGVDATVYLRSSFTPSRVDMSDREVVLTQEARHESAVAFSSDGHFYGWFQKQADAEREQAIALELSTRREALRGLSLPGPSGSREEVRSAIHGVLSLFDHLQPLAAQTSVVSKAAEYIVRPRHPYE